MKKIVNGLLVLTVLLVLAACGSTSADEENGKDLTIGATAGPYSDQLKFAITPILEEQGYTVEVVEFNDYIQPNNALDGGEINANLYQHKVYLDNFNADHGMDLIALFAVPTAPIGLYSETLTSLDDIEEGMKITLPNDPTNLARALKMLVDYEWITLKEDINPLTVSEKDVDENFLNLQLEPIDPAQTPRSLSDTDFAFVNGNFAIASGLELDSAIDLEVTPDDYLNYFVVQGEDEDAEFVQDIRAAFESDAFLEYAEENLQGYAYPDYLK